MTADYRFRSTGRRAVPIYREGPIAARSAHYAARATELEVTRTIAIFVSTLTGAGVIALMLWKLRAHCTP